MQGDQSIQLFDKTEISLHYTKVIKLINLIKTLVKFQMHHCKNA